MTQSLQRWTPQDLADWVASYLREQVLHGLGVHRDHLRDWLRQPASVTSISRRALREGCSGVRPSSEAFAVLVAAALEQQGVEVFTPPLAIKNPRLAVTVLPKNPTERTLP